MSFGFPKPPPPPKPRYNFSDVDYAELLLRLSIFGFSKLSVSDQQDKTEEMREKVVEDVIVEQLPKESDEDFRLRMFTDLFKKLPMAEQNLFLSSVVKIFKRHRRFDELISWFKQRGARDQQEMIENIVPAIAPKNLSFPGETVDDFRLRRFTQLSAVYTDYVYRKFLVTWGHCDKRLQILKGSGSDEEGNSDGRSDEDSPEASGDDDDDECLDKETNEATYEDKDREEASDQDNVVKMSRFAEFFLGFSIVWFEGENRGNQGRLIDQLCDGVKGVIIEKLPNESKEEFKLRKFTELCKKVVDFVIQERFLGIAEKILWKETCQSLPHGKLLQPQDSASAAELCMRLTSFGFSLLPTLDQRHKVKEISESVHGGVKKMKRLANESTSEFRMRKFKELSPSRMHFSMFKEFTKKFFRQRQLHESISIFRQLVSKDQQEDLIEKMFERLMVPAGSHEYMNHETTSSVVDIQDEYDEDAEYMVGVEVEIQDIIVERFTDESEENFRLRRFITMCSKHPILCKMFLGRTEAGKCDRKGTPIHSSNNDQEIEETKEYRYAEFYLGLSVIWFKARCANISRNPIQVLFGKVEADRLIEKLPDESEEDFKLRRFTESFKQLPFSSQEKLVKYIRKTLSYDIGEQFRHYRPYKQSFGRGSSRLPQQYTPQTSFPQGSGSFYPEFIKVRNPNPRGDPPIKTTNGSEGATAN